MLPWMVTMLAAVIRSGIPPRFCTKLAGDHQCRQGSVQAIRLSHWAGLFLVEESKGMLHRIQRSIQLNGMPRHHT